MYLRIISSGCEFSGNMLLGTCIPSLGHAMQVPSINEIYLVHGTSILNPGENYVYHHYWLFFACPLTHAIWGQTPGREIVSCIIT